jgi:hypothetical protein
MILLDKIAAIEVKKKPLSECDVRCSPYNLL